MCNVLLTTVIIQRLQFYLLERNNVLFIILEKIKIQGFNEFFQNCDYKESDI